MTANSQRQLKTVSQIAKLLQVSPLSIRRWARAGTIPAIKAGRDWRFDYSEVLKVRKNKRPGHGKTIHG